MGTPVLGGMASGCLVPIHASPGPLFSGSLPSLSSAISSQVQDIFPPSFSSSPCGRCFKAHILYIRGAGPVVYQETKGTSSCYLETECMSQAALDRLRAEF